MRALELPFTSFCSACVHKSTTRCERIRVWMNGVCWGSGVVWCSCSASALVLMLIPTGRWLIVCVLLPLCCFVVRQKTLTCPIACCACPTAVLFPSLSLWWLVLVRARQGVAFMASVKYTTSPTTESTAAASKLASFLPLSRLYV